MTLPEIGGRRLDNTQADFEHRCRVWLGQEQEKISPDNALIAILCDAVRLSREYCDVATDQYNPRAEAAETHRDGLLAVAELVAGLERGEDIALELPTIITAAKNAIKDAEK